MKKIYIQPETIVVNLHTEGMIAASIGFGRSDNKVDASSALTNKKESSIWGDSQEEGKGGIW
jgi:hypothetical protein